ncbi:MAG TPA: HD domain-containing phosphohydrolase [Thermomicrobiales bacterium]|nr:HD domain-containing phosphohydrolase [Thermomicrobiales bacterium]
MSTLDSPAFARAPRAPLLATWRGRCAAALLVAYLVLGIAVLTSSAAPVALGIRAAWDGAVGAWVVTEVAPTSLAWSAGVRAGDRLVEVNGRPPGPDDPQLAQRLAHATQAVAADPATQEAREVGAVGQRLRAPNRLAYFGMSVIFFGVGLGALTLGRGAAPRALALVCCLGAAGLVNLQAVYHQVPWALSLNGIFIPCFMGAFAYLFLVFPTPRAIRLGGWRLPPWAVLAPAPVVAVAWELWIGLPRQSALNAATVWLGYLYFLGCLAGGCGLLVSSWWRAATRRERDQLRIVTFGSVLAVLPFVLLSLVPHALLGRELLAPEVTVAATALMPLAFGYAILRHQVMDLQLYVRRGLAYSALAAIVTGVYALALFTLTLFLQGRAGASNVIAVAIMGAVAALFGQPIRRVVQGSIDRLFDRRSYDYRRQLLEFSRRMSGILDPDELARSSIELIAQTMGATQVRLYLCDPDGRIYRLWAATDAPGPAPLEVPAARVQAAGLAAGGDTLQRVDAAPGEDALLLALENKGHPVALLTLGPKCADLPYSSEDLSLLRTVANHLATATENAQLYARMRDLYLSSIRSLAATVDAKDAYTHGHSERVAIYARQIAAVLGLPRLEIETIELAALLHDIGKIGIPDAVLLKPGRLDRDEWLLMMRHAQLGADILAGNPALASLVPLVRHHHERYDGGGYPDGLAGAAIPLGAAIIGVADTVDTMTTNRPYREAPGWPKAIAEVQRCAGGQFHPDVAAAFLVAAEQGQWAAEPVRATVSTLTTYPVSDAMMSAVSRTLSLVQQMAHVGRGA